MLANAIRWLSILLFLGSTAAADDWPQWMGPKRDNIWREEGLLEKFPAEGPRIVWRVPVAGGYTGPAVVNGRVFVADYVTDDNVRVDNFRRSEFTGDERMLCLDEATGDVKWTHEYPVKYTISYPAGPRCTPTVDGDRVYMLGAEGNLFCLRADNGDVIWQKNLPAEYDTKTALWGYASHPLVDGDKLICIVGGEGSHVVAFNKHTGAEIWRALTSKDQGYAPPVILEIAGRRQLVLLRPDAVTGLDPETGREYWSTPFDADQGLVVMSPILWNDHLFVGGYANKNMLLKLAPDGMGAEVDWRGNNRHGVSPVNVQPAIDGDTLYGVDHADGQLYAIELATGNRLWNTIQPVAQDDTARPRVGSGTAFVIRQGETGDRYWLFNDSGDVIIANLTPAGYEELDRAHVIEPTNTAFGRDVVWCMPAFANQRMYVRNDEECICVDLAAGQ